MIEAEQKWREKERGEIVEMLEKTLLHDAYIYQDNFDEIQ